MCNEAKHIPVFHSSFDTCLHDLDQWNNLVHVFACGYQSLQHEDLEVFEHVTSEAAHHLQKNTIYCE